MIQKPAKKSDSPQKQTDLSLAFLKSKSIDNLFLQAGRQLSAHAETAAKNLPGGAELTSVTKFFRDVER